VANTFVRQRANHLPGASAQKGEVHASEVLLDKDWRATALPIPGLNLRAILSR
jgi:hypothetical protein